MSKSLLNVPNKYIDEDGVQWTYSRCFFCHMNCGIMIGVDTETDKVVEIRGNEKEGTVLCDRMGKKGEKAIQFHYHPKRINHPLKRVGERGEDRWQQISYDQALDEIAQKLAKIKQEYGPEALVSSEGTYRSDHLWARTRFFNLFGNPGNVVDPGTICWCYNYTVNMAMTGWPIESMSPISYDDTQTFVVWGKRVSECYGPQSPMWRSYLKALARKDNPPKLIQVDPTCTAQSIIADHWLALYPGTDLLMMLAWINYIIYNNLHDEAFCKNWTNGVFLVRKDDNRLLRTIDVFEDGNNEDFVVWDQSRNAIGKWNSDENRYYDEDVDAALYGEYEVKTLSGETITCVTVFDALKEHVAEYTVEKAANVTGCRETEIVAAAYTYATNGPAFIGWGLGGGDQHGPNAAATAIAKTILRIICGNIDIPGGEYVGEPGPIPGLDGKKTFPMRDAELEMSELATPEIRDKFIGVDQFKIMSWRGFEPIDTCYRKMFDVPRPMLHQMLNSPTLMWDAILEEKPYPVKAMICWGSNPLCWNANTKHVYKALKGLELLVVCEYWKTPTAALADYILPAADCLERPCCSTAEDSNDFSVIGDRGSKPLYERHMDYDFFRELGCRLGQEEHWPWEKYEEVIEHRIERVPDLDYTKAVEQGTYFPSPTRYYKYLDILPTNGQVRGFATPSRKCEIMPSVIQDLGYEALPVYRELPETPLSKPEIAREYPLRLAVAGRVSTLYHSEFRVPGQGTRSLYPWPTVQINLEDARELDIRDGDWVWIETLRGRIRQKAKVDAGIVRGLVMAQPSWWFPELPAEEPWCQGIFESNGNVLTDDAIETLDPGTASWVTRGMLCKVYPCIDPTERIDTYVTGEGFTQGDTYFNKAFEPLKEWRLNEDI